MPGRSRSGPKKSPSALTRSTRTSRPALSWQRASRGRRKTSKKMKISKFLYSQNPMVNDQGYVFHSRSPRFLAEVVEIEPGSPDSIKFDGKHWGLKVIDQIDPASEDAIRKEIRLALKWLKAYLVNTEG